MYVCSAKPQKELDDEMYLPGWKMQYVKVPEPKITLLHEGDIFYGLGSCPYKAVTPADLDNAKSPEEIVRFYMAVLRTWCLEKEFEAIMTLIKDGALQVEGQLLTVPPNSIFK